MNDNLIQKINYIKENKESAILALTSYIDSIYNLTNEYFDNVIQEDENGNERIVRVLKQGLIPDEKAENFIKELNIDAEGYEKIRGKLQKNDFNLSLVEVTRIGLSFVYSGAIIEKRIKAYNQALAEIQKAIEIFIDKDTQNIDFSKE